MDKFTGFKWLLNQQQNERQQPQQQAHSKQQSLVQVGFIKDWGDAYLETKYHASIF